MGFLSEIFGLFNDVEVKVVDSKSDDKKAEFLKETAKEKKL